MKTKSCLHVLFSLLVSLLLFSAFFYNLVREGFKTLLERNATLESLGLLAVPGTGFLGEIGTMDILKSSLFFVVALGVLILTFQALAVLIKNRAGRAAYLFIGLIGILFLLYNDRILIHFFLITVLSMTTFYLITLDVHVKVSARDGLTLLVLGCAISGSLFLGARKDFFLKARDFVFMDTALGSGIVTYYYKYSPLAASVLTPAMYNYQGILFDEKFQTLPFKDIGNGLILTGNKAVEKKADYRLVIEGGQPLLKNRFGDTVVISSPKKKDLIRALHELFALKGFRRFNTIGLYALPACIIFLAFLYLRMITPKRGIFVGFAFFLGIAIILFVTIISLQGNSYPSAKDSEILGDKELALGVAYNLNDKKEIPERYYPLVSGMAASDSTALRYWGAKLLMRSAGDPKRFEVLKGLLSDPSPNVRYTAALSLGGILKSESFESLIPLLLKDPNWYVRCMVFSVFRKYGVTPRLA